MSIDFQGSLFETETVGVGPLAGRMQRTTLSRGAWVDVLPGWFEGADQVFEELVEQVPWRAERRQMYDAEVDVPRLLHTYGIGEALPHEALARARDDLSAHYAPELGEPFVTAGCCYYRDGHDSVAWHGDNLGRGRSSDTMVAIVSFGSPRKLQLRPVGGHTAVSHALGHGDLIVMGGSCQRTWEHAVPKTSRPVGPRISVQFRPRNVF
jgi:alkylated DNA repair dioxygenase AlkB